MLEKSRVLVDKGIVSFIIENIPKGTFRSRKDRGIVSSIKLIMIGDIHTLKNRSNNREFVHLVEVI